MAVDKADRPRIHEEQEEPRDVEQKGTQNAQNASPGRNRGEKERELRRQDAAGEGQREHDQPQREEDDVWRMGEDAGHGGQIRHGCGEPACG